MEQQFSLSWNNFHCNLTKGFAGLLGNGEFVDVTLAVDGHLLQAHKVILSICSPYFKKMFQMNPCQHPIVVLRDVSHKAMTDLLQFMYHGEVSVKREDLTSFIGTAEVLQIKGLTNKETDDDIEKLQPSSKPTPENSNNVPDNESCSSEPYEQNSQEETILTVQNELMKQQFIDKLHRLSNLKRKSEEFLQKNYYSDILSSEKRPKAKEKPIPHNKPNHMLSNINYNNMKSIYDDTPIDISSSYKQSSSNKEITNESNDHLETGVEVKTECDDMDIIVTDPAVCTTPKSFDASREGKKDQTTLPMEYSSPQDNCASLNNLFMDLKNLVNGKGPNILRPNVTDEFPKPNMEHRLVTIPQKEDGKKKYPQRSCRLCWKMGKRRDTRFMCIACELPFCKTPCFDIHFSNILKLSQFQGDYYAT